MKVKLQKLFKLFLLAILCSGTSYSQEIEIGFTETDFSCSEVYGNNGNSLFQINVQVIKKKTLTKNYSITVKSSDVTTKSEDYELLTSAFTLTGNDFSSKDTLLVKISLAIAKDTLKENDEVMKLSLESSDTTVSFNNSSANLTILNASEPVDFLEKSLFNPFRVTIGANFDFQEREASSFYFDIYAYKPDLLHFNQSRFFFGFYSSIYHNKYSSIDSIPQNREYYDFVGYLPGDSAILIQDKSEVTSLTSIKNVAFEGGFTFSYFDKLKNDKDQTNSTISMSLLLPEISGRRISQSTAYTFESISMDTLFAPYSDTLNLATKAETVNSTDYYTSIGGGIILQYRHTEFGEFYAKLTGGQLWTNSTRDGLYLSCRLQYVDPNFGLNLGGEVRAVVGNPRNRYFGVYLSKSFTLKRLAEY